MVLGNMQTESFNLVRLIQHAARWHGKTEVVTNSVEGGIHRINYEQIYDRVCQLANGLRKLGVAPGDRVGTMAWNTWRHLECWYAISGSGAICHTLNPRLSASQLEYIVGHAEDHYIFVDLSFVGIIVQNIKNLPTLRGIIILTNRENMPEDIDLPIDVYCYEDLLAEEDAAFDWPEFSEEQASSLCYTSGTTGDPKGVLYSHRSNMAHAWATAGPDCMRLTAQDSYLMIVPMFHANSWGLAFSLPMVGAKLVMTGPHMAGEAVFGLLESEKVTASAAVPTVWTGLLNYLDENNLSVPSFNETVIGGSAAPVSMIKRFEQDYGVDVIHAWGMTEVSPLGTINRPTPRLDGLDYDARLQMRAKQGRAVFGIDMKIVDEQGNELPRDGVAFGQLMVRGHWVIERYFKSDESALDADGWLDTGDVATIDEDGFMQITDRSKDLIKSGGEWISSIDIENTAVGHPDVNLAACIGASHPKWEERPLLLVVKQEGSDPTIESIREQIASVHAKWQVPDDVVFLDEMPLTATGKIDKKPLRKTFGDFYASTS